MTDVIKRSGNKEEFNPDKIRSSIKKAAIDAGETSEKTFENVKSVAGEVIEESEKKDEIETSEIRKNILNKLDNIEKKVAEAWRRFDKKYKI
jgi:transcriptional repressor NrdR